MTQNKTRDIKLNSLLELPTEMYCYCSVQYLIYKHTILSLDGKDYNIYKPKGKINYTRTLVETIHNHSWNVSLEVT